MSSIKLAPNASGTGEFTIAAPNSNTNRTFSLPDQSGSFITTDSSGAAVLPRVDSSNEGGQINFNRAVDNVANWSIDSFGNTTTPTLRFIDTANVRMAIDGSGNVGIGTSSPGGRLDVETASGVVYTNLSATSGGSASVLSLLGGSSSEQAICYNSSALRFGTVTGKNGAGFTERARIDSSGNLLVNTTSNNGFSATRLQVLAPGGGAGGLVRVTNNGDWAWFFLNNSGSVVGNISAGASSTAYNTTSDYRLKENVQPLQNALARIAALKPCTYTWKESGDSGEGFIAHELAEVFPDAVTGEKDAVNEDGSIKPQGIDTSFLVATLTAAIQEQQAMIQTLTARIEALEAK